MFPCLWEVCINIITIINVTFFFYQSIRNELECVTNHTLANVIRELSSLSKHAEDMFCELSQETIAVFSRATQLQRRIEDVQEKVTQLNATVEEG